MPSNEHITAIESALNGAGQAFHLAVDSTVQEVEKTIAEHKESQSGLLDAGRAELGMFAQGKLRIEDFTAVMPRSQALDSVKVGALERSVAILRDLSQSLRGARLATVAAGGLMTNAVEEALYQVGQAFGAARIIGLVKTGAYDPEVHAELLQGAPFRVWTKSERQVAPPLIINVAGEDLNAGALAKYLDGGIKLVLACRGACPPAPLVRLITPRTYVVQTSDPLDLAPMMKWQGPGVGLVAGDCARFVHNPAGGGTLSARLTVDALPDNPKQSLGGISVRQQLEELEQLAVLSGLSGAAAPVQETSSKPELPADPADKLAAWLLSQARDLSS